MTGLLSSAGVAGHVGQPGTLAASTIPAPHIEYSQLAPMLIVFGAALAGVLVEAFAPRAARRGLHLVLALGSLGAAFILTIFIAASSTFTASVDGTARSYTSPATTTASAWWLTA